MIDCNLKVIELSNSKLALLLGTDLFSLNRANFSEVATNIEGGYHSIAVEVGPKGARELFKLSLVI